MSRVQFLAIVLIGLISGLSAWLHTVLKAPPSHPTQTTQGTIDYSLEDVRAVVMEDDGALRYQLQAPRLEHFAQSGEVWVVAPRIRYLSTDAQQWQAQAQHAVISADGDEVLLQGAVSATRDNGVAVDEMRFATEELRLLTRAARAETDAPVEFKGRGHHIRATGMRADLAEGQVELLADVHGIHSATLR